MTTKAGDRSWDSNRPHNRECCTAHTAALCRSNRPRTLDNLAAHRASLWDNNRRSTNKAASDTHGHAACSSYDTGRTTTRDNRPEQTTLQSVRSLKQRPNSKSISSASRSWVDRLCAQFSGITIGPISAGASGFSSAASTPGAGTGAGGTAGAAVSMGIMKSAPCW